MPARQGLVRLAGSYIVLASFLVIVLIHGIENDFRTRSQTLGVDAENGSTLKSKMPDVSQYIYMNRLDSKTLHIDDQSRRILFIGDVHGMQKELDSLLSKAEYDPSNDLLIHVGDIVAKGTHAGSMSVLKYMSTHNITGVRGNHDEKVIEWRGWMEWVRSHKGGAEWLQRVDEMTAKELEEYEIEGAKKKPKEKWKRIPKGWKFGKDHYKIARDMNEEEYAYLLRLPLVLHLPSLHAFVVHAGILPHDPHHSVSATRQPLAHIPKKLDVPPPKPAPSRLDIEREPEAVKHLNLHRAKSDSDEGDASSRKHSKWNMTAMRNAQELSVLADVPQNADPWVLTNMRGVTKRGDATKENDEGIAWAKLWNTVVSKCHGFDPPTRRDEDDEDEDGGNFENADEEDDDELDMDEIPNNLAADPLKSKDLPCYPATVIYGHAAKRGLDIKRWTKGLDSGCVYDRKLTAMIVTVRKNNDNLLNTYRKKFGEDDRYHAKFVSVSC